MQLSLLTRRTLAAYLVNASLLLPVAHASVSHNPVNCQVIGGNVHVRDDEHLDDAALHHTIWIWETQDKSGGRL